jgi:hypothetical protein
VSAALSNVRSVVSLLIFFSAVEPMILDVFRKVRVRAGELVVLFVMQTAVLVPLLAAVTAARDRLGVFGGPMR